MTEPRVSAVVFATIASPQPMGQQAYEEEVIQGVRALEPPDLALHRRVVRSVRSSVLGNVRLPMKQVERSASAAAVGAAWAYRGADLVHRCDLRLPPARRPGREVVTVHDLAFELFPDEGGVPPYAQSAVRRSRVVITPSEFSAAQLRERWGLRDVRAILNGVDQQFAQQTLLTSEDRAQLGAPDRFVLHSGGCSERKNLPALAQAWRAVSQHIPDVTLVLAGPPDPRRTALFADLARTSLVGRLPRAVHVRAVQAATTVVVPSVYEGFGLPAAEAMLAGIPVVAADAASLPEVCGDAGLLVEPSAEGLAAGLEAVLTDGTLAGRLRAAGPARAARFTWKASAHAHLDVYREMLATL